MSRGWRGVKRQRKKKLGMNGSAELGAPGRASMHGGSGRGRAPLGAGSAAALVACPELCGGGWAALRGSPGAGRCGAAALGAPPARRGGREGGRPAGARGVGGPGAPPRPAMQIQGAGRGRRDSEPRKRGETPYKNYWGPFPARTTKAPETAAACGGSERGGLLGGAGRPLRRRWAASVPAGARRAAQAAALQVGHLPLSCSTAWLRGAFSPPPPPPSSFIYFLNLIS